MSIATLLRRISFACIVLVAFPLAATTRTGGTLLLGRVTR